MICPHCYAVVIDTHNQLCPKCNKKWGEKTSVSISEKRSYLKQQLSEEIGNDKSKAFSIATKFECEGRLNEAIACFEVVLQNYPNDATATFRIGWNLRLSGQYSEALKYFDRTIQLAPEFAENWYNKGMALVQLGRYREAMDCFNKAGKASIPYYRASSDRELNRLYTQCEEKLKGN